MVYTFARISAVVGMQVEDYFGAVPLPQTERPLSVQRRDLRCRHRQWLTRAETGRSD